MRFSRVFRAVSWLASTSVLASLALTSTATAQTATPRHPAPAAVAPGTASPSTPASSGLPARRARGKHHHATTAPLSPTRVAQLAAVASDAPVEIPSQETDTTKLFANPDGSFTLNSYAGVVQVNRAGAWLPVDTTLAASGGTVAPKVAEGGQRFSDGGSGPLATVTRGAAEVQFDWPGSLPAPVLAGNTATYRGVVAGGDLVVAADPDGFEFSLVYRSRPASAPVLDIPMTLSGLTLAQNSDGTLTLADPAGTVVASAPAPRMFDASVDVNTGDPGNVRTVASTVKQTGSGPVLELRPDFGWLSDPATVYPVTVDPTTTLTDGLDAYVDRAFPTTNYNGTADIHAGYYYDSTQAYYGLDRSFLTFNMGAVSHRDTSTAVLHLYETHSVAASKARQPCSKKKGLRRLAESFPISARRSISRTCWRASYDRHAARRGEFGKPGSTTCIAPGSSHSIGVTRCRCSQDG